jgi:hypothetical protein
MKRVLFFKRHGLLIITLFIYYVLYGAIYGFSEQLLLISFGLLVGLIWGTRHGKSILAEDMDVKLAEILKSIKDIRSMYDKGVE